MRALLAQTAAAAALLPSLFLAAPATAEDSSYVSVATARGTILCAVSSAQVGCQGAFANSPVLDGERANSVSVAPDGSVHWLLGDLGSADFAPLGSGSHAASGWTISASGDGVRFDNDRTGHGAFISIESVTAF